MVHLRLFEPFQVFRYFPKTQGVETKVTEKKHICNNKLINILREIYICCVIVLVEVIRSGELNKPLITYAGAEPSRCGGRGCPGNHSADMEKRDVAFAPAPAGRATEVANWDFEDERRIGNTAQQLLSELEAI